MTSIEIVRALEQQGWRCVKSRRNNHWKCYPPGSGRAVVLASSTGDRRSWLNARSLLRRQGAML